jgi:O-acetyl-ADP-ribose deacetylase (regulator of RNase III)
MRVVQGDITQQAVDAIVNAANQQLQRGGGVDGAIHRAAGPELQEACNRIGGCPTGEARITKGYDLPARHVIHTVGPRWKGGVRGEEGLLRSCYRSSLDMAREHGLRSIAFPSISTGAYGYPIEEAAPVAAGAVRDWLAEHPDPFELVRFVLFSGRDLAVYRKALGVL